MRRLTDHILLLIVSATILLASCKGGKAASSSAPTGGEIIEPEQVKARVDTRFQEKFFQAQDHKARGEWDKAYVAFAECISIDAKASAAPHYEMSRIDRIARQDANAAYAHAQKAVQLDPLNPWYHHELADVLMEQGKYNQAAKAYREVEKLNPDDPNNLYEQATALMYAGDLREAIEVYDRLEKRSGVYEELSIQKHQLWLELNDVQKAGEEIEKLARAFPEEVRYWGMALQFYQQSGQKEKEVLALQKLAESGGGDGFVHLQLSEYYASKGNDQRSYEELLKAFGTTDVDIDKKIGVLLRYFSLTEFDPSYKDQAYELLDRTIALHPGEAKGYSMYGDFLYRDRRDTEALAMYKKALEFDKSRSQIWAQVINIQAQSALYDELLTTSGEAMELFPNQPEFYLYHGMAHERRKAYADALDAYLVGKELVIDNTRLLAQFYASIGSCQHYLANYVSSDEAFDEAIRLSPSDPFIQNNYAYYLATRNTKLDKAERLSRSSNELSPGSASFQDTYAWILYRLERYPEALSWIEKSVSSSLKPGGEVLEHYGDILFRLGRTADAVEQWKKARSAGGTSDQIEQKITLQRIPE